MTGFRLPARLAGPMAFSRLGRALCLLLAVAATVGTGPAVVAAAPDLLPADMKEIESLAPEQARELLGRSDQIFCSTV